MCNLQQHHVNFIFSQKVPCNRVLTFHTFQAFFILSFHKKCLAKSVLYFHTFPDTSSFHKNCLVKKCFSLPHLSLHYSSFHKKCLGTKFPHILHPCTYLWELDLARYSSGTRKHKRHYILAYSLSNCALASAAAALLLRRRELLGAGEAGGPLLGLLVGEGRGGVS